MYDIMPAEMLASEFARCSLWPAAGDRVAGEVERADPSRRREFRG
jgi:hypothetical protein